MCLLFRLAEWHAFAKLRIHTESTLTQMEKVTSIIGRQLRDFCNITCKDFNTTELPKEAQARARKETRRQTKRAPKPSSHALPTPRMGKRAKTLNLFIYKLHALGDYAEHIRRFGTTDSYSTQIVSIIYLVVLCLLTDVNSGRA